MSNEEMKQALLDKLTAEQDKYRTWLLEQPPEEILKHTYEEVCCKGRNQNS